MRTYCENKYNKSAGTGVGKEGCRRMQKDAERKTERGRKEAESLLNELFNQLSNKLPNIFGSSASGSDFIIRNH